MKGPLVAAIRSCVRIMGDSVARVQRRPWPRTGNYGLKLKGGQCRITQENKNWRHVKAMGLWVINYMHRSAENSIFSTINKRSTDGGPRYAQGRRIYAISDVSFHRYDCYPVLMCRKDSANQTIDIQVCDVMQHQTYFINHLFKSDQYTASALSDQTGISFQIQNVSNKNNIL